MNCLLIHDPKQGHSRDLHCLEDRLNERCVYYNVNNPFPTSLTEEVFGAVILWCSIRWWKENRIKIKGRPWVCAISWCFDDLMDVTTPGMGQIDAGVHCIITNCMEYVRQSSAAFETHFSLKPLEVAKPVGLFDKATFGTVLPNVKDRDFSQLIYTRSYLLAKLGEDYVNDHFLIRSLKTDDMRVPSVLYPYVSENECGFSGIRYFIPAPRITDYRGGVFPPEIYEALARGCTPLLIKHPVLDRQTMGITTAYSNLYDYNSALDRAITGNLVIQKADREAHVEPYSSFRSIANHVKSAYRKWVANAPSNVQT